MIANTRAALAMTFLLSAGSAHAAFIEMFDAPLGGAALDSIAEAEAVIAASGGADFTTTAFDQIDFNGDNFPGSAFGAPPDDLFVMRVTGTIDTDLYPQLVMTHDDGFVVRLGGADFFSFNGNTSPITTTSPSLGNNGVVAFEMIFWDQGGAQVARLSSNVNGVNVLVDIADPARVPAPGVLGLLGTGLLLGALARRRRTHRVE